LISPNGPRLPSPQDLSPLTARPDPSLLRAGFVFMTFRMKPAVSQISLRPMSPVFRIRGGVFANDHQSRDVKRYNPWRQPFPPHLPRPCLLPFHPIRLPFFPRSATRFAGKVTARDISPTVQKLSPLFSMQIPFFFFNVRHRCIALQNFPCMGGWFFPYFFAIHTSSI